MAHANFIYREVIENVLSQYEISQHDMLKMNKRSVNRAKLFVESLDDETKLETLAKLYSLPVLWEWNEPKKLKFKSIKNYIRG